MKRILYITMENGRRLTKPSSIKSFLQEDEECMITYTENGQENINLATKLSGETVLIGDEEFTIDGDDEIQPIVNESLTQIIREEKKKVESLLNEKNNSYFKSSADFNGFSNDIVAVVPGFKWIVIRTSDGAGRYSSVKLDVNKFTKRLIEIMNNDTILTEMLNEFAIKKQKEKSK